MRLLPAPAGSGIVFRRTDLDNFEIPATGRNVAKVSYATSLMRQGVLISTTEHLLSALIGYGHRQRHRRARQSGAAHPRWQRASLRGGLPVRRHSNAAPPPRVSPHSQNRRSPRRQQVHRRLSRRRATASPTPSTFPRPSASRILSARSGHGRVRHADRRRAHLRLSRR